MCYNKPTSIEFLKSNNWIIDVSAPKKGSPQGSDLDPLLFLFYVNDLPAVLCDLVSLFADAGKVVFSRSRTNRLLYSFVVQ